VGLPKVYYKHYTPEVGDVIVDFGAGWGTRRLLTCPSMMYVASGLKFFLLLTSVLSMTFSEGDPELAGMLLCCWK